MNERVRRLSRIRLGQASLIAAGAAAVASGELPSTLLGLAIGLALGYLQGCAECLGKRHRITPGDAR